MLRVSFLANVVVGPSQQDKNYYRIWQTNSFYISLANHLIEILNLFDIILL